MLDLALSRKDATSVRADAVALFCAEGSKHPDGVPAGALRRALARAMAAEGFTGKEGEALVWHAPDGSAAGRYLVLGTGNARDADLETVRKIFAALARRLERSARHLAAPLPAAKGAGEAERLQAAAEGLLLGGYRWDAWLSRNEGSARKPRLSRATLLASPVKANKEALSRAQVACRATLLARELVCEAPSTLTPREMERRARKVARAHGLTIKVLDEKAAARKGMGCFLGVARGSDEPPRLIHLTYKPARKPKGRVKRVALVGKGITFDSGGLSLKPSTSMETMKCDMAGSAAVLATMSALKPLRCPVEVHGILMMTENMPSGRAYKPGDILRSMSGKSVEVLNTDAEGRLVLADGLEYARRLKPDRMVDLATLTGACVVALGNQCTGVMGFDDGAVEEILAAARATGEKMWRLPLFKEYRTLLDSKVADIKHVGSRWGGAITAGLFLGDFAGRDIPWVHLDIAGPAFAEEDQPLARVGGTGHPVRTLLRYLDSVG